MYQCDAWNLRRSRLSSSIYRNRVASFLSRNIYISRNSKEIAKRLTAHRLLARAQDTIPSEFIISYTKALATIIYLRVCHLIDLACPLDQRETVSVDRYNLRVSASID